MSEPKIEDIFHEALDRGPEARRQYLNEVCGEGTPLHQEVESLLDAHEKAGDFMAEPSIDLGPLRSGGGADAAVISEGPGWSIGPYRIIEQIGEGGFGLVFLAEQREPVRRRVALKIIKQGMDTKQVIARFEAERQALAMMDHPGIARVLDAGATETGRPYFVMDLVRGEPITAYCDRERLTIPERLELFQQVCSAVQHAHQKGIIHRDIKPANVLVTLQDGRPVPTVIDFGIAKAIFGRLTEGTVFTDQGQLLGTPEYMSPEQAEPGSADIDTRTDVYSLGVLLYELLTGTTPFDGRTLRNAGYAEIHRIIRDEEPVKPSTRLGTLVSRSGDSARRTGEDKSSASDAGGDPSGSSPSLDPAVIARLRRTDTRQLSQHLRGDLDWIVIKAMDKNRARRYESASGLAKDVDRYLTHQPVEAGPPSRLYRAQKFIRRNRIGVTAALLVGVSLVLGIVGAGAGLARALHEADRADRQAEVALAAKAETEQRAEELELVVEFQNKQLRETDPELMGVRLRRSILDKRRSALEAAGLEEEEVAEAVEALEASLAGVNFTDVALDSLDENIVERALTTIDEEFAEHPVLRATLLHSTAVTLRRLGLLERAMAPMTEALDIRRRILGDEHPYTLSSLHQMGTILRVQGEYSEAEMYIREALEGRRRVLGDEHPDTLASVHSFGALLRLQGEHAEAEPHLREALEGRRRVLGDHHPRTLNSIHSLAILLVSQGKFDEAEPHLRKAFEGYRRVLGDQHPSTLNSINSLAALLFSLGKYDEAEPYLREAMEGYRRVLGDHNPRTLNLIHNLGALLDSQGRFDEAEPHLREALEGYRRVLGDDHPRTLKSIKVLAGLLISLGKYNEAELYCREAMEGRRRVLGDHHPDTLESIQQMGVWFLRSRGEYGKAEQHYREALEGRRRVLGDDHPSTLASIQNMGYFLQSQGQNEAAGQYYREALEGRRRVQGDHHPSTLIVIHNMGAWFRSRGEYTNAEQYQSEALDGFRRVFGDEHPHTLSAIHEMGTLLRSQGEYTQAEPYYREALKVSRRVLGDDHPDTLASISNMGGLLRSMGEHHKAEQYRREALDGFRRVLGDDHPNTQIAIHNMAVLLQARGEYTNAEPYYREALESRQRLLGNEHPNTLASVHNVGASLEGQGNYETAERYYRKAVEGRRRVLGDEHRSTLSSISRLGVVLRHMEHYAEAESLGAEAASTARRVMPEDRLTGIILRRYALTLAAMERFEQAEAILLEAAAIVVSVDGEDSESTHEEFEHLANFYQDWHKHDPDAGHDIAAAKWRAKLPSDRSEATETSGDS